MYICINQTTWKHKHTIVREQETSILINNFNIRQFIYIGYFYMIAHMLHDLHGFKTNYELFDANSFAFFSIIHIALA